LLSPTFVAHKQAPISQRSSQANLLRLRPINRSSLSRSSQVVNLLLFLVDLSECLLATRSGKLRDLLELQLAPVAASLQLDNWLQRCLLDSQKAPQLAGAFSRRDEEEIRRKKKKFSRKFFLHFRPTNPFFSFSSLFLARRRLENYCLC